jgi:hypothetical protein
MKMYDIRERAEHTPFRPFALETTSGSRIEVERAADIFLPERRPEMVIVFEKTGRMWLLDVDQIADLEVK